ncbi:hypothetical protein FSP39_007209 [Pinctada imbricata]|uniref:Uncharacterized protein n=1 Tax=Pinctada imbricata TaxID=66713 RepID=A0AA88YQP1_PINIB|nr:hypothetical protein FSP39_007209 [Pinctada imbricata]
MNESCLRMCTNAPLTQFLRDKNVRGSTVHITPYMCPISKKSWIDKSEQTHCQKPKEYHCFRASRNQYVDVCLFIFKLDPRDGCPYIELNKGLSDLLQYFKCTASHGCPSVYDPVYNSTELYKYPACIYGNAYTTEGYYNNKKTTARKREEITTKKLTEDTDEQVTTVNSQSTDINFFWNTSNGRGSLIQQSKDNKSQIKKGLVILKIGGPVAALIMITMVVCLVIICRRRFSIPNKSVTTIGQELHQVNFTENKEDVYMEIKDVPSCSKENYYNAVYASDQPPYQTHGIISI